MKANLNKSFSISLQMKLICFSIITILFSFLLFQTSSAAPREELDITFGKVAGSELKGDMYIPDGTGPFPALLSIHGGGFVGGDKKVAQVVDFARSFSAQGYAVFNINYRLLRDGGVFPNNIKDTKCGLAWLRTNAAKFNIDINRIGVIGESAGAYFAAMLALTSNDPDFQPVCEGLAKADTSVAAGVLYYPPTDFITFKNSFSKLLEMEIQRLSGIKSKKKIEEYKKYYSPVNHVTKDAPPLFLSWSEPDNTVPSSQDRELIDKLKSAGATYDFLEVKGAGIDHGFITYTTDTPQAKESMARALAFLEKYLKNKTITAAP